MEAQAQHLPNGTNDRLVLRGLYDARVRARELVQILEEITDVESEAVRLRVEQRANSLSSPAVVLTGGVGLFLLISCSYWGSPPVWAGGHLGGGMAEISPKKPTATPEAGLAAMRAGDHRGAVPLLRAAADAGHDPDLCLGRMAESQFRINDLDGALSTCAELDVKSPNSHWAPYVRGMVLKKRGDREGAKYCFNVAALRGHPLAEAQLRTLK